MICPTCRHENLPQRSFCGACGALLVSHCPRCGFRNLLADRFCGGCGDRLAGAREARVEAGAEAPEVTGGGDEGLRELLEAAAEAAREPEDAEDVKVTQNDIDALFGD